MTTTPTVDVETLTPEDVKKVNEYAGYLKQRRSSAVAGQPAWMDRINAMRDDDEWYEMKEFHPSPITLASEGALAKDWLTPEEDAAWADL